MPFQPVCRLGVSPADRFRRFVKNGGWGGPQPHKMQDVGLTFHTEGFEGLTKLHGVGPQIGAAIAEMIRTGPWEQLQRLRGKKDPDALFSRDRGSSSTAPNSHPISGRRST